tara:strand:- start:383 stop:586 length:204 start_codon:yes stop_codon:yes gene_type:complete
MQLLPKKSNLLTPNSHEVPIKLFWIIKFSKRNSVGLLKFAKMPPTFAAAIITTFGLYLLNHYLTAFK